MINFINSQLFHFSNKLLYYYFYGNRGKMGPGIEAKEFIW